MKHHKEKALEEECLCNKCPLRFQCFTQERIFSNPIFQGLFEALMANGRTREQALEEVTNEIKFRMGSTVDLSAPNDDKSSGTIPWINPYIHHDWFSDSDGWKLGDSVTITGGDDVVSDTINISYKLATGEEISWSADASKFNTIG